MELDNEFMEELKKMIGKELLIFLKNDFRYKGTLINIIGSFVVISDHKSGQNKMISIDKISEIEYDN